MNQRLTWLTGRALAWVSYDVASSVYVGAVPSVLAPLYIQELMKGSGNSNAVWGLLSALAVLVSSLAALGAASAAGRMSRFSLLTILTASLLAAMAGLAWNPASSLIHAAFFFVAAQSFYVAATTIYESFLTDIAPEERRQTLSGLGWATGYLGGLIAILVLLALIAGKPQSLEVLALCYGALLVMASVMFAAVLLFMRSQGFGAMDRSGAPKLRSVLAAAGQLRSDRSLAQLFAGMVLVQMGIFVVVTFTAPILSERFGQSLADLLWLLLIIHIVSVPSTMAWSYLMNGVARFAAMAVLMTCWLLVLLLLAFGSGAWMPVVTVLIIGCCLGATLSGLRGFLAERASSANTVALFALATALGRFAAALGPVLFALMTLLGGERVALVGALLVLACGAGFILLHVRGLRPGQDVQLN